MMASESIKRGSYAVGRDRRERILAVATERFTYAGYARTSLAEIAREVGITTPGLMHHFPTKQHLLLAIVERRFETAQSIAEASAGQPDGTRTLQLLQHLTERFVADPGVMKLFVLVSADAADPSSPAHELFAERYERVVADVAAMFEAEAQAGALRGGLDYRSIARECIAVNDGLQLQWVVTDGKVDISAISRAYFERLAPTLLATPRAVQIG